MGTPLKSGETVIGEIVVGLPLDVMVAPHGDNVFLSPTTGWSTSIVVAFAPR